MKNLFPGYYKKTETEIKSIWETGLIIFDTNVLLNLYRYSDSTRETILNLVSKFSEQIWLPNQTALEYNRNRYEVIAEQEKAYKEFLEKISQIQKDLQSTNKPPFLSIQVDNSLNKVFENVSAEVHESIKRNCEYLKDDPIYNKLSILFANRITESYSKEKLQEIYKEGEERYKTKTPPGFEDEKTKDGNRKYGDLVLWKQIIEIAKNQKKHIILITDERKIDWWWKIKDGRNMGPRQELVEEIKQEANVDFHMYSSERFLSYGQSFLNEHVNQKALKEIQAMKNAELDELKRIKSIREEQLYKRNNIMKEIDYTQIKLNEINNRIYDIEKKQNNLFENSLENLDVQEHIHNLNIHKSALDIEQNELSKRLEYLKSISTNDRNIYSSIIEKSVKNMYKQNFSETNE